MAHTQKIKRLLESLGFVHIAGWVRNEDAPAIRRKIEAAREEVDNARRDADADLERKKRDGGK